MMQYNIYIVFEYRSCNFPRIGCKKKNLGVFVYLQFPYFMPIFFENF